MAFGSSKQSVVSSFCQPASCHMHGRQVTRERNATIGSWPDDLTVHPTPEATNQNSSILTIRWLSDIDDKLDDH